jgi:hypothetical protein
MTLLYTTNLEFETFEIEQQESMGLEILQSCIKKIKN